MTDLNRTSYEFYLFSDAVVPPGRSLANPSAMKAVIDLEKRNPAIPPAEAAAAPRFVPPVHGPLFVRPRPPASLNGHGGGGLVQKKVDIPPEKTELTPSQIMVINKCLEIFGIN